MAVRGDGMAANYQEAYVVVKTKCHELLQVPPEQHVVPSVRCVRAVVQRLQFPKMTHPLGRRTSQPEPGVGIRIAHPDSRCYLLDRCHENFRFHELRLRPC